MQRRTFGNSYATRDRLARGLMLLAALGAFTAFIGSIGAVGMAGSDTQQVETWRMLGFVMFTGVFLLLAVAPRKYPGLWELVVLNKAALTVAEVALALNDASAAATSAAVDGILTVLILTAYVLGRGYESWWPRRQRSMVG